MKRARFMIAMLLLLTTTAMQAQEQESNSLSTQVSRTLRKSILRNAQWALQQEPVTVTASHSPRSAGGIHDFYSEADYWWPDPEHPDSPYIRKDGLSNPGNFVAHRQAMIRFSKIVGSLASAYRITHNDQYARAAIRHAKAWFVDSATRMNPNLLYAQAIKGRVTGRGIGIIDAIHLMEVVKGLEAIEKTCPQQQVALFDQFRNWFREFITWLTQHAYGREEMEAKNNHGTCWVMQVAVFAHFTGNREMMEFCRQRYKEVLLPRQMSALGSFPLELSRTKPYGYSLFNLDAMASICQELSTPADNLWIYETADGKSIRKGIEFILPYVADKSRWPYPHDVMYWNDWPVAQPFLLFGALQWHQTEWLALWKKLNHDPANEEVIRNLPVRNPLLWIN